MRPATPSGACGIAVVAISGDALRRQFEAGYAAAHACGCLVQPLNGLTRLMERFDGLLRGLAQLREGLGDLLGAGRLGLHAFVDGFTARSQRLHLLDDLRQLDADLLHLLHAPPDLLGELVHAHHARRTPPTGFP